MRDTRFGSRFAPPHFTGRRAGYRQRLAAAPIAVHARHNHRAARPVFLHVGCRAVPHRIASRKIARIDVIRFRLAARIDRHASRRPSNPDLTVGLRGGGWRRLCRPHPGRRRLRLRSGRGQQKCPDKGQPNCRRLDPRHRAHPNLLSTLRSPIAAPTSTGPEVQNRYPVSPAGQAFAPKCYKRTPCGNPPKRHPSPKWKPWRTRFSSACRRTFAGCARA